MAIADMRTAHGLDPSDARVGKRLKEWSAERKQQKRTEIKTFGGMFERGSMSVAGEDTGAAAAAEGGGSSCGSGGGRGQFERYSSMAELEADVAKMKDALSAAEYNNNRAEARMLRQRLRNIDEWLEKAKAKAVRARQGWAGSVARTEKLLLTGCCCVDCGGSEESHAGLEQPQ